MFSAHIHRALNYFSFIEHLTFNTTAFYAHSVLCTQARRAFCINHFSINRLWEIWLNEANVSLSKARLLCNRFQGGLSCHRRRCRCHQMKHNSRSFFVLSNPFTLLLSEFGGLFPIESTLISPLSISFFLYGIDGINAWKIVVCVRLTLPLSLSLSPSRKAKIKRNLHARRCSILLVNNWDKFTV